MKKTNFFVPVMLGLLVGMMLTACGGELNPKTEGHIASALEAKQGEFKACYEDLLTRNRNAQGQAVLQLEFTGAKKTVKKAKLKKSQLKDPQMKKCVVNAAEGITLPEPPGVSVEGHYDLTFAHEK